MYRCREIWSVLVTAVVAGGACGGTSVSPIDVALGCPERPLRGPDAWASEPGDRLIDDFEDGDATLAPAGGRNGSWVLGQSNFTGTLIAETSSRCAARGGQAGHFAGVGVTDWGANWTAVFRSNNGGPAVPYDGRAYSAISFWAAVGSGATPPYEAPVGLTTMDNAWNSGGCTTCMDYYGVTVPLTSSWRRVVVDLGDLAQAGFGVPQVATRRDQMVGFIIWPKHQFDIWIDDVRFEP